MGSRVVAAPVILVLLSCTALPKERISYLVDKLRIRVSRALLHQLRISAGQQDLNLPHKEPRRALLGAAPPSSSKAAIPTSIGVL